DSQPRAARAELSDDADELIARRERRLRPAEIGAGAQLRVGERYAGGQHPDADFAPPGARRLRLHELENLGTAEPRDDNSLHGPGRSARSLRVLNTNKPQRRRAGLHAAPQPPSAQCQPDPDHYHQAARDVVEPACLPASMQLLAQRPSAVGVDLEAG